MRTLINDSEEFQAALIYPERARPKRGVSPRWRTAAIIGWIFVVVLTVLAARGDEIKISPTPGTKHTTKKERPSDEVLTQAPGAEIPPRPAKVDRPSFRIHHSSFIIISKPSPAPVAGVSPALKHLPAGCPPTLAARRHRGILSMNFGGGCSRAGRPTNGLFIPGLLRPAPLHL